jgi:hypothetical protein
MDLSSLGEDPGDKRASSIPQHRDQYSESLGGHLEELDSKFAYILCMHRNGIVSNNLCLNILLNVLVDA